jgi:hypothetical protein
MGSAQDRLADGHPSNNGNCARLQSRRRLPEAGVSLTLGAPLCSPKEQFSIAASAAAAMNQSDLAFGAESFGSVTTAAALRIVIIVPSVRSRLKRCYRRAGGGRLGSCPVGAVKLYLGLPLQLTDLHDPAAHSSTGDDSRRS